MPKTRIRSVDIAKGIGIILVVLGHSLKQTQVDTRWMRALITLIYSFHMPLFFLLSGFVARKILNMKTYRDRLLYIKGRAVRLLIPYFFISLLYIPVKLKLASYAVKPFTVSDSLKILVGQSPDVSLWFLYVLFVVSAVAALCVNESNFRSFLYGAAVLGVAAWWTNIPVNTPKYLAFFLAGIWVRLKYEDLQKEENRKTILQADKNLVIVRQEAAGPVPEEDQGTEGRTRLLEGQGLLAGLASICFLILNRIYFHNGINIYRLGSSVCGIYVTLWASEWLARKGEESGLGSILEKAGLISMDIYILHEPIMTAAKILFWNKLSLPYPLATLLIFLTALLVPIPVSKQVIRKAPLLRFLIFGENPRHVGARKRKMGAEEEQSYEQGGWESR